MSIDDKQTYPWRLADPATNFHQTANDGTPMPTQTVTITDPNTKDVKTILGGLNQYGQCAPKTEVCPSCGYCPHCGRGGYRTHPYYPVPYYPTFPTTPYPYWWHVTIGSGTGFSGSTNG